MPAGRKTKKNNIITIKNATFRYGKSYALTDITLTIDSGEFLGVVGSNGSGKTTLTYLLNGLIPHMIDGTLEGNVSVCGQSTKTQNVSFFARRVGMVFQNPDFSLFNLTVREEILFGLNSLKIADTEDRMMDALRLVGMEKYTDRNPRTLSYGQKQKINIASVLALNTDIIVLDEPSAMLDYKNAIELYEILTVANANDKTIIVVDHDTDLVAQYCSRVVLMHEGQIATSGTTKRVFAATKKLKQLHIKPPHVRIV